MPRMETNVFRLRPSKFRGLLEATFPFRPEDGFREALKQWPGVTYGPKVGLPAGIWLVPEELGYQAGRLAEEWGMKVGGQRDHDGPAKPEAVNEELHPYQVEAVWHGRRALAWMLNFEMGLGKTAAAIETMRLAGVKSALIVCPALVRLNWKDELDKWWSEHPEVAVISTGKQAESWLPPGIGIVSYELLPKLLEAPASGPYTAIVVDESHYIANNRAGRAKNVRALLDANRSAIHLALTATPVTNEPKGLWFQLDSLWPHRFGSWPAFMKRYAIVESNAYTDWHVHGLNPDNADELRERLAAVSSRVTKAEVAHLLPPFTVQTVRVPPRDRGFNPRELLDKFTRMDAHRNNGEELIRAAGEQKVESAIEQVVEALDSGVTHVAVLTHLNVTANEIAAKLIGDGLPAVLVDEEDIPKRMEALKKLRASRTAVMVTTMHKVNVGIDLTCFPVAILAELDYTPANVIQALGRFSRLSGKVPSTCILLVLAGTQDEIVAMKVLAKVKDINAVVKAGQSEQAVAKALAPAQDDAAFFKELQEAAMHQCQGDVYDG